MKLNLSSKIEPQDHFKNHRTVFIQNFNASLPGFLLGYSLGSLNAVKNVIVYLNHWQDPDEIATQYSIMTSSLPLGAIIGPLLSTFLFNRFHQHLTQIFYLLDLISLIALIIQIISPEFILITLARFCLGFTIGINCALIPVYVREFSPKEDTGITGSLLTLLFGIGLISVYLIGMLLPSSEEFQKKNYSYNDENVWRIVMGVPIITCVLRSFFILTVFNLEIPSVMIHEHHQSELEHYFRQIYSEEYWLNEMQEIEKEVKAIDKAEADDKQMNSIQEESNQSNPKNVNVCDKSPGGNHNKQTMLEIIQLPTPTLSLAQQFEQQNQEQQQRFQGHEHEIQPMISLQNKIKNETKQISNNQENHEQNTNEIFIHEIELQNKGNLEIQNTKNLCALETGNQNNHYKKDDNHNNLFHSAVDVGKMNIDMEKSRDFGAVKEVKLQITQGIKADGKNDNLTMKTDPFNLSYQRRLKMCLILAVGNQSSGIGALIYYSNTIFQKFDKRNTFYYSLGLSIFYWILGLLSMQLLVLHGRRPLILKGGIGLLLGLILIIIFNELESFIGLYIGIFVHGVGYNIGIGNVSWIYITEIMNPKGVAIFTLAYWVSSFSVSMTTPQMINQIGITGTFIVFFIASVIVLIYCFIEMKESIGKSKQQIAIFYCQSHQIPDQLQKHIPFLDQDDFREFLRVQKYQKHNYLRSMPNLYISESK